MLRRSIFVLPLFATFPVLASDTTQVDAARKAAADWLGLVDSSEAAKSWEQASSAFKRAVTSQQWAQSSSAVRAPLGTVKQRQELGAQVTKSLPGAPDGEYVLFQFQTAFETKSSSIETVTVVYDTDNTWRVTGYFIK